MKYALQPWADLPTRALGTANLALTEEDRERVGEPFTSAILTYDWGWLRTHTGYAWQAGPSTVPFGPNDPLKLLDRPVIPPW